MNAREIIIIRGPACSSENRNIYFHHSLFFQEKDYLHIVFQVFCWYQLATIREKKINLEQKITTVIWKESICESKFTESL